MLVTIATNRVTLSKVGFGSMIIQFIGIRSLRNGRRAVKMF